MGIEAYESDILSKLASIESRSKVLRAHVEKNTSEVSESILRRVDYGYQTVKIKDKQARLKNQIDQLVIKQKSLQDSNQVKHLRFVYEEIREILATGFHKFLLLHHSNDFNLKKKILYYDLFGFMRPVEYPSKYMEPDNYRLDLKIYLVSLERFVVLDSRSKQIKIEDTRFQILFKLDIKPEYDCSVFLFKSNIVLVLSDDANAKTYVYTLDYFNLRIKNKKNISQLVYDSNKTYSVDYFLYQYSKQNQFILKLMYASNQNQGYVKAKTPNKYLVFEIDSLKLVKKFTESTLNDYSPTSTNSPMNTMSGGAEMSFIFLSNEKIIAKKYSQREIEVICSLSKQSKVILKNSPFSSNVIVDSDLNVFILTKNVSDGRKYLYCFDLNGEFLFRKHIDVFDESLIKFDMYDEKLFFSKRFKLVATM